MEGKDKILFERLLRLALCPSAPEGEWSTAASKLVGLLRSRGVKAEEFLGLPSGGTRNGARQTPPPPSGGLPVRMPFGKYRDFYVKDIARQDPSYLRWVLRNLTKMSPYLRGVIEEALEERYGY